MLNRRQARWAQYLASFNFEIIYRKGSLNPANEPSRRPDYRDYTEEPDQTILPTLQTKLRCKGEVNAINIHINLVLIKLATGSGQSISLPENKESAQTQMILIEDAVDSNDDSDSENKLPSPNSYHEIAQTLPRVIVREALKNQSRYIEPDGSVTNLLLQLQQKDAFCIRKS